MAMQLRLLRTASRPEVNPRLLRCSVYIAAAIVLSGFWLIFLCMGSSHRFQIQASQSCIGQTNRSSFVHSQSNKYQCYGPPGMTEAVVVSIFDGIQDLHAQKAIRSNRAAYVEQHGYRYCEISRRLDPTRKASWNKIIAVLLFMHCSKLVLALDSDAIIVNHGTRLQDVWNEHGGSKDILFSADYGPPSMVNAGVILAKTSAWSIMFLQHLYNNHMNWEQHGGFGQEQGAINDYAKSHPNAFKQHTAIINQQVFNTHSPGSFIAHYAGWEPSAERYKQIAADLAHPEGLWANYTQEAAAVSNSSSMSHQLCTDAIRVVAPQWKLKDRILAGLSQSTGLLYLMLRWFTVPSRLEGLPRTHLTVGRADAGHNATDQDKHMGKSCQQNWSLTVVY